jgi:hypothetical protein
MGMSFVRCMSRTSGRSLRLPPADVRVNEPAFCSSLARGRVERSSSSTSISFEDMEEAEEAEDLLRRFAGLSDDAHSGTGLSRWNCRRNRLVYSLPVTISSVSVTLSFRNLGFPASETMSRSSSLSSHAAASPLCDCPSSDAGRRTKASPLTADGASSKKNS